MKRVGLLLALSCGVVGCAAGTRPAAPATPHAPAPQASSWRQYSLPLMGLHAGFPEPPDEAAGQTQRNNIRVNYAGFSLENKGNEFLCLLVDMKRRADDKVALANAVKVLGPGVHKVRSLVVHGFRGVDAAGKDAKGAHIVRRLVVVGNSVVVAGVRNKHHAIDPTLAKRFITGCRFSIPWRVVPWIDEGMTVAVPANTIENDKEKPKTTTRSYYLGGVDELAFFVSATRLDPSLTASPRVANMFLDRAASNLTSSGYKIQFTSAVEHDGVLGRELLMSKKHQLRWRLFIVGGYFYQLGVISDRAPALREAAARRFFDSVTWSQHQTQ